MCLTTDLLFNYKNNGGSKAGSQCIPLKNTQLGLKTAFQKNPDVGKQNGLLMKHHSNKICKQKIKLAITMFTLRRAYN